MKVFSFSLFALALMVLFLTAPQTSYAAEQSKTDNSSKAYQYRQGNQGVCSNPDCPYFNIAPKGSMKYDSSKTKELRQKRGRGENGKGRRGGNGNRKGRGKQDRQRKRDGSCRR